MHLTLVSSHSEATFVHIDVMRLRLPKSIDYALSNKKWRVEKAKLRELRVPDGIYPFTTSNALNGNLLLDRTLTFPIQVS